VISATSKSNAMARPKHYSPQLSRFVVSVLYHEAKHRKIPMTKLTDDLLRQSLQGTEGWITATTLKAADITLPPRSELSKAA
jgi:hypothetical protein